MSAKDFVYKGRRFAGALVGRDVWHRIQVKCPRERHGTAYGGWDICPLGLTKDSVVYSFGVGEDISFDLSLIARYGLEIHAFDPTPRSIEWVRAQSPPPQFRLHEFGLAHYDGKASFNPPENPDFISHTMLERPSTQHNALEVEVRRLATILERLHHDRIDVLKMDIEGAEYAVIEDILHSDLEIHQLLVEFHHMFPQVTVAQTKAAVKRLHERGFRIFSVSPKGHEYSFLKG